MAYDIFGYPIKPRSDLFATVSRLMYNYEEGEITPGQVDCSLWGLAGNYSETPEDALVLYKTLVNLCFPENSIETVLRQMLQRGESKISLIKYFRDYQRQHNKEDGLRYCKEYVEELFGI